MYLHIALAAKPWTGQLDFFSAMGLDESCLELGARLG